ncbi:MAG: right-handed parallel beta-helix repeat-containing protein, partial [Phycisphaerae bacterium]|nr:right-handed parallel beta-helix repeat-containing protein [Phycisphaerae bacterium]
NSVDSWDGGGIYVENSSPSILNCTIADNVTNDDGIGGALACYDGAEPVVKDCIISGNSDYGIALYEDGSYGTTPSDPNITFCLFHDNFGGDYIIYDESSYPIDETIYSGTAIPGSVGNIEDDPMFVTGRLGNYYLSNGFAGQILVDDVNEVLLDANSPAIDAGSDTSEVLDMNSVSTRTDNEPDIGQVDIGFHYKDPQTAANYVLTINIGPEGFGTVKVDPNGTVVTSSGKTFTFKQYSQWYLKASPNADNQFDYWDRDGVAVSTLKNYVVVMNTNRVMTAYFETVMVELITSTSGEDGSLFPTTHRPRFYKRGTVVELTAVPANPLHVVIWTGTDDDFSILLKNKITMDDPLTNGKKFVNAEFYAPQTHTVGMEMDYLQIQNIIDNAHSRDIIKFLPGDYVSPAGGGESNVFWVTGKAITLKGRTGDPNAVHLFSGFVVSNVGRNTVFKDLTITGNYFTRDGCNGKDTTCSNPHEDGKHASGLEGGGMELLNASPDVRNCVFIDCSLLAGDGGNGASGGDGGWGGWARGGAVNVDPCSNPLFTNCKFIDNQVRGGDGGAGGTSPDGFGGSWGDGFAPRWYWPVPTPYPSYSSPQLDNYWFTGFGGAVYCEGGSAPEFVDCDFVGNRTYGGSNGLSGSALIPQRHYMIQSFGGAVFAESFSTPIFRGCYFSDNQPDVNGPTQWKQADATIVRGFPYISYGGAIAITDDAHVTIENCIFEENLAELGGAIYGSWCEPQISDSNFVNNTAQHGGAIIFTGATTKIARSNFNGNEAINLAGLGGAIASMGANLLLSDCDISDNFAATGGGVYISNKNIDGNDVLTGGQTVLLRNCLIHKNTADQFGGGVYVEGHADPWIIGCTIADNEVAYGRGGGLYCSYGSYTHLVNSILWNNYANFGKQISIATTDIYDPVPSVVDVNYCDIEGGAAAVDVAPQQGTVTCELRWNDSTNLTGIANSDPCFVSKAMFDYFLSAADLAIPDANQIIDSPCIDKGVGSVTDPNDPNIKTNFDVCFYRHTTRTDLAIDRNPVDIGYHFVRPIDLVGDFNFDGVVDIEDYVRIFIQFWLADDCEFPDWCSGADLDENGIVNFIDEGIFKLNYGEEEKTPPFPNPPRWRRAPISGGNGAASITMAAIEAIDNSGYPVLYYFQRVDVNGNDDPSFQGHWQEDFKFTDSVPVGVEKGYKFRVTDYKHGYLPGDANAPWDWNDANDLNWPFDITDWDDPDIGNRTQWSIVGYAVAGTPSINPDDYNAPMPDPMTWATGGQPQATDAYTAIMTATAATDAEGSGVEYMFQRENGPTVWQDSRTFTDPNLDPNTTYRFRCAARDKSINQNQTGWSDWEQITTPAPGQTTTLVPVINRGQQLYRSTGTMVNWYHRLYATAPDNGNSVWIRFVTSKSEFNSGWMLVAPGAQQMYEKIVKWSYWTSGGLTLTWTVQASYDGGTTIDSVSEPFTIYWSDVYNPYTNPTDTGGDGGGF